MNLSSVKGFVKGLHPSNRLRIASGNTIDLTGDRLNTRVLVDGAGNKVAIHASVRLRNLSIEIRGANNLLTIGEGCVVQRGSIELFGDGNEIRIGPDGQIVDASIVAHWGTRIEIGSNCLFSSEVDVRTTDSHSILDESGARINKDMDVKLGDRVWLGRRASVVKGAEIGDDAVIGTMAVVAGVIPSNCVAGGIPAKVIRQGTTWSTERL